MCDTGCIQKNAMQVLSEFVESGRHRPCVLGTSRPFSRSLRSEFRRAGMRGAAWQG